MKNNSALITRIAIGKTIGFIIGLIGFFMLPQFMPDVSMQLQWGVLLWYITFGAIIGVFGELTFIPIINISFPWWIRNPYIGGWLNLVLCLVAYQEFEMLFKAFYESYGIFASPYWIVVEGMIVGFIIGLVTNKFLKD